MWQTIKPLILWNYGRTTRQYEIICALCIAFIFLTPPSWFPGKERTVSPVDNQVVTKLIISPEIFSSAASDNAKLEIVRQLSGNQNVQNFESREQRDQNGKLIAYEIIVR